MELQLKQSHVYQYFNNFAPLLVPDLSFAKVLHISLGSWPSFQGETGRLFWHRSRGIFEQDLPQRLFPIDSREEIAPRAL